MLFIQNKKKIQSVILLCFICSGIVSAQNVSVSRGYVLPAIVVGNDTLALVKLQQITVFPPLKFTSHEDYLRYRRLVRDVRKVYPYAQIARRTMIEIQMGLDSITRQRDRKKYIKDKESELMSIYAEELKSMTVRQGQILIKLVDRELDKTTYEIIKELRGGMQAFMWQQVARMFGESLKSQYDGVGEDLLIERIILMIEEGRL
jgi:hypothetical protein